MARSPDDAYEEDDRPRRPRDDGYDDPPRRSRDDDYDDRPRMVRAKSGAVTAVGIVTIIVGSLSVLAGFCVFLMGVLLGGAAADVNRLGGGQAPAGIMGAGAAILILISLVSLVLGGLGIWGGTGVLSRRHVGRIITLVVAGFAGVGGAANLIFGFAAMGQPGGAGTGFISVLFGLLYIGYCVWAYIVLLNSRFAAEFS